jgi:hypothetical protein
MVETFIIKEPKLLFCEYCKTDFESYLKMNGEFFKTCDTCRYNKRKQGQKNRDENKLKNKFKTYT